MMNTQKYQIIKKLDSGGMAEVFQASVETIKGFKKTVAIKRIRPNLIEDQKFVQMFMDEARLSLYLQHANIASVFDVGTSGDHFFIVMEYVEGMNLRSILEHIPSKKISIPMAVYIINNVCEALDYAHSLRDSASGRHLNIVHRDISPPNILLSVQGEIKLVDFGLAKAANQEEESDPGIIKGKFSYLSPEAAMGLTVDHRTDIFAAGIILWELISGKRLFHGETDYDTVSLVRDAKVPELNDSDVPEELWKIILKSLARDPELRYQKAGDMSEDLTSFLFNYGKAVQKRDISKLVAEAQKSRKRKEPSALISRDSLLTNLIQDELNKLISLGTDLEHGEDDIGAAPISLESLEVSHSMEATTPPVFENQQPEKTSSETEHESYEDQFPPVDLKNHHTTTSRPISFMRKHQDTSSKNWIVPVIILILALAAAVYFLILR
ncbi:MAG: serine/threonine protein kinase [Deltaproteobacteria bacterium]|nr:serine/threonine protein kinase [Deltaproteobacteria bacterium]